MTSTAHRTDHERSDARVAPLVVAILGLAAVIVLVLVLSRAMLGTLAARSDRADQRSPGPPWPAEPVPGPRLQADPQADYEAYAAAQRELISSYGWIDPEQGIVRVPVERAMELVLERGLPARAAAPEDGR